MEVLGTKSIPLHEMTPKRCNELEGDKFQKYITEVKQAACMHRLMFDHEVSERAQQPDLSNLSMVEADQESQGGTTG